MLARSAHERTVGWCEPKFSSTKASVSRNACSASSHMPSLWYCSLRSSTTTINTISTPCRRSTGFWTGARSCTPRG
jgi:hypothetical protein